MLDDEGKPIGAERRVLEFYKKDIIEYLTRVRGPEPFPLKLNPFPRPTGESADIVVTEYDVPMKDGTHSWAKLDPKTGHITQYRLNEDNSTVRNDNPEYPGNEFRDGSDWSRGLRVSYQEHGQHDLVFGKDGYVYFPPSIGVGLDPQGNVWYRRTKWPSSLTSRRKSSRRSRCRKDGPIFNNGKDVDSKGIFWGAQPNGVYRLESQDRKIYRIQVKNSDWKALRTHHRFRRQRLDRANRCRQGRLRQWPHWRSRRGGACLPSTMRISAQRTAKSAAAGS